MRRAFRLAVVALCLFFSAPAFSYERIVSFRPNVTEILFALGLGSKVVGVTSFCRYPPEAEKIEKIGGYFNRSLEKTLSLKPDLVVMVPDATTPKVEAALRRSKIEVVVVKADTVSDVETAVRTIAAKAGVSDKAEALIQNMHLRREALLKSVDGLPKKKALMVIQRRPLIAAGGGTFLDDLLKDAGLQNIAGSSSLPYPHFSLETVIAKAPEVIIDLDPSDAGDYWSRYPSLPAVKNGAVAKLSPDLFVPGPRIPDALQALIDATRAR
ncbi:MAG TPA: helical backbone metal receptor [bacterium]|nr:helical backbone metal receptor [bacterium]